jgi:hypothetical protein
MGMVRVTMEKIEVVAIEQNQKQLERKWALLQNESRQSFHSKKQVNSGLFRLTQWISQWLTL